MGSSSPPRVIQWILDTRHLWPDAKQSRELETHASTAMALLPPQDRDRVYRNYHVRDAKMVLGSYLLKHYLIASLYPDLSWGEIQLTRDKHHKPIYVDKQGEERVRFNVSHQAGLVVLVAVAGYSSGIVDVGVDIVSPAERRDRDRKTVIEESWSAFVDVYADVFARSEVNYLKYSLHTIRRGEEEVDFRLRCFYTLWCLREAYVKMTAEALVAEWLGQLEFRAFVPPKPTDGCETEAREEKGEVVRVRDVWFWGKTVEDVQVVMGSLGADFMVATAVRTRPEAGDGLRLGLRGFEMVGIEEVVRFAEGRV